MKKHKYFQKQQKFFEIGVLKNFAIFTRKHLCFHNAAELAPGILLEKFMNTLTKLHYRVFVMDLVYRYYKYSKAATEIYSNK